MSGLLIYTAGHTDVQLIDGEVRRELNRGSSGELHEQLAERRRDWTLGSSAVPKAPQEGSGASALPDGELQLCTPKLDAVLALLEREQLGLEHALILHTDRPAKSKDPTQAGPILQQRLRERTGVEAALVSYLSGSERLEDRRDPRDAILRREVAARIEEAIAAAFEHAAGKLSHLVVAAAGGFPEVAALTREVVRLHAGKMEVRDLDIADARQHASDGIDQAIQRVASTDPSAVALAKRHALDLVERGSFIAAWGAVAHLHDDEAPAAWTQVLKWLYQWASSLPQDPPMAPGALPFPTSEQRAANAAMRVELALRCGDIPRAVQGTFSFFEAAVWDHLYARHLKPLAAGGDGRLQFHVEPEPVGLKGFKLIRGVATTDGKNAYNVGNFGEQSRVIASEYLSAHHPEKTLELLGLAGQIHHAEHPRNLVAHGEPNRARIEGARAKMRQHGLWSRDDRFLSQPLVGKVLVELGIAEPSGLCEKLIEAVRAQITSAWRTP